MAEDTKQGDKVLVGFTAYITLKSGKRIWARSYGKKAFPIYVRRSSKKTRS